MPGILMAFRDLSQFCATRNAPTYSLPTASARGPSAMISTSAKNIGSLAPTRDATTFPVQWPYKLKGNLAPTRDATTFPVQWPYKLKGDLAPTRGATTFPILWPPDLLKCSGIT